MGIEEFALSVRAHQQLMGVLAVDVDKHFAQFTQLHERGRRTVDERPRTPARIDYAAKHDRIGVADSQRVLVQPARDLRVGRKLSGDVRARFAGPHNAGVGARAERERERVDQNRLAGAGFARKYGKAALELEV